MREDFGQNAALDEEETTETPEQIAEAIAIAQRIKEQGGVVVITPDTNGEIFGAHLETRDLG